MAGCSSARGRGSIACPSEIPISCSRAGSVTVVSAAFVSIISCDGWDCESLRMEVGEFVDEPIDHLLQRQGSPRAMRRSARRLLTVSNEFLGEDNPDLTKEIA